MARHTIRQGMALLIALWITGAQAYLWGGAKKEVCLCKIVKPEEGKDVFICIGKEAVKQEEDFNFITRVFKVHHKVDTLWLWDGKTWSSSPDEAQGYTREQMNIFFRQGRESIPTLACMGPADYRRLLEKWGDEWKAKIAVRDPKTKFLAFQTKDAFFGQKRRGYLSVYHIPAARSDDTITPDSLILDVEEEEPKVEVSYYTDAWRGAKVFGWLVVGGRVLYLLKRQEGDSDPKDKHKAGKKYNSTSGSEKNPPKKKIQEEPHIYHGYLLDMKKLSTLGL